MMLTCIDACCAINLLKGDALDVVSRITSRRLCIQGLVEDEISADDFSQIIRLSHEGVFELISGDDILASEVDAISSRHNIGLGESECIVIAQRMNCHVASDDRKARGAATVELGNGRVIGSLGLLRDAVAAQLIGADVANRMYEKMKEGGGFLPRISDKYFTEATDALSGTG